MSSGNGDVPTENAAPANQMPDSALPESALRCEWVEEVSAAIDGELDDSARTGALAHAVDCASCASIVDLAGARVHRGPWAESVHLVELIGVFLLWRVTPTHLLPWTRSSAGGNDGAVTVGVERTSVR